MELGSGHLEVNFQLLIYSSTLSFEIIFLKARHSINSDRSRIVFDGIPPTTNNRSCPRVSLLLLHLRETNQRLRFAPDPLHSLLRVSSPACSGPRARHRSKYIYVKWISIGGIVFSCFLPLRLWRKENVREKYEWRKMEKKLTQLFVFSSWSTLHSFRTAWELNVVPPSSVSWFIVLVNELGSRLSVVLP